MDGFHDINEKFHKVWNRFSIPFMIETESAAREAYH